MSKPTNAYIATLGVLTTLLAISFLKGMTFFIWDYIALVILMSLWYFLSAKLEISPFVLGVFFIGPFMHASGTVFGFYGLPMNPEWDSIAHTMGMLPMGAVFFRRLFLSYGTKKIVTKSNAMCFLISFLAAIGVGAALENIEYIGFLVYGHGDGAFRVGEGDIMIGSDPHELRGAWGDMESDMLFNGLGALVGIILTTAWLNVTHKYGSMHRYLRKSGYPSFFFSRSFKRYILNEE
jgi:hypothetical protein